MGPLRDPVSELLLGRERESSARITNATKKYTLERIYICMYRCYKA